MAYKHILIAVDLSPESKVLVEKPFLWRVLIMPKSL
jgi:hypothetical protein